MPLVTLVEETSARVRAAHERGRAPLLAGGDGPVLLGALAAIGDGAGLLMLDGHEDAWPPPVSETGEASTARSRSHSDVWTACLSRLPGWFR